MYISIMYWKKVYEYNYVKDGVGKVKISLSCMWKFNTVTM